MSGSPSLLLPILWITVLVGTLITCLVGFWHSGHWLSGLWLSGPRLSGPWPVLHGSSALLPYLAQRKGLWGPVASHMILPRQALTHCPLGVFALAQVLIPSRGCLAPNPEPHLHPPAREKERERHGNIYISNIPFPWVAFLLFPIFALICEIE